MLNITLPNNWTPRSYQLPFFQAMDSGIKRACLVEHRRAGKDSQVLNYTAKAMFGRVGNYWHLFPKQVQARKAIWNGIDRQGRKIIDQVFPEALRKRKQEQEMMIEVASGSTWQMCGSDNYDSLVGANPCGVVFSEWPLCDPAAWDFIRPILAENQGTAVFIYTPRGKNHGYHLYKMAKKNKNWYSVLYTVDDTKRDDGSPVIGPEIIAEERAEGMLEEKIQQEYYCSFDAQIPGAVYALEMAAAYNDKRIGVLPIEPQLDVHTFWDLGRNKNSGNMAIWFIQALGKEIRAINYYQNHGKGMAHYINYLKEFKAKHSIRYGNHYAPHDIGVHELMNNKTRLQTAREMGIIFRVVPRVDKLQNGIEATRRIFARCWFDENRCDLGISALSSYQYEFNEKLQQYSDTPLHDWTSDGADAFRQMGQAWTDTLAQRTRRKAQPTRMKVDIDPFKQ